MQSPTPSVAGLEFLGLLLNAHFILNKIIKLLKKIFIDS